MWTERPGHMGMDMCMALERKVGLKMDARTCQMRMTVMMCAARGECPLPKAVMELIARLLVPSAAKWAPCKFVEHIVAKPERWAELHASFEQEMEDCLEELNDEHGEDPEGDDYRYTIDEMVTERLDLTRESFTSRFSDRGGIFSLINSAAWPWRDTTGRPAQLSCMIPGIPADIEEERRCEVDMWDDHPIGLGM